MNRLLNLFKPQHPAPARKKPAAAPAVAAQAEPPAADHQTLVLIAAALAAYGYSPSQIVSIRPLGSAGWTHAGRVETVQNRNRMFQ